MARFELSLKKLIESLQTWPCPPGFTKSMYFFAQLETRSGSSFGAEFSYDQLTEPASLITMVSRDGINVIHLDNSVLCPLLNLCAENWTINRVN